MTESATQPTRRPVRHPVGTTASDTAIEVIGLRKHYGSAQAVDDLSFTASFGRIVGFLGPNGAGKTTTLRTLLGLIRPTAGIATIDGHAYADLPDPTRTVGALLDGGASHPGRSGRDHLRVLARAAGVSDRRVEELLNLVGLDQAADQRSGGYSLGMHQRLGLAAALLGDPKVLVLDEPANGLDPHGVGWLRELLRSFAAEGRAVLVASHALAEIAQTVDDIVIIRDGRSVLQSSLDDLLAGHVAAVRVSGRHAERLGQLLHSDGAHITAPVPGTIVVGDRSEEEILRVVARHRMVISEITPLGSPLEEIYLELTTSPKEGSR